VHLLVCNIQCIFKMHGATIKIQLHRFTFPPKTKQMTVARLQNNVRCMVFSVQ